MTSCSSPAPPGSSARTTSATCWRHRRQVTVYDALTYAGNRANARRSRRRSAVPVRARRHLRPGRGRRRRWPGTTPSSTSPPRRTSTARINDPYAVRAHELSRHATCCATWPASVGVERFLHISTDEVYGIDRDAARSAETDAVRRRARRTRRPRPGQRPASRWATGPTYGLPGARAPARSNSSGRTSSREKVIPLFITNLLDGAKVPLYGDGGNVRDWLHVRRQRARRRPRPARAARSARSTTSAPRQRDHQRRADPPAAGLAGRDESFIEPVDGPPRPRPAVLDHDRQDRGARLASAEHDLDDGAGRDGRVVPRPTGRGGSRSKAAPSQRSDGAAARHRAPAGSSATTSCVAADGGRRRRRRRSTTPTLDVTDRDAVLGAVDALRARRRRQLRGVDGGRRLRGRSRAGLRGQRPRRALGRRGVRPRRRPPRARLDGLRLRRHARPPVPRVGRDRPAVGVRRVEAGRRARGAGARRPAPPSCARRGCAASTGANMVKHRAPPGRRAGRAAGRWRSSTTSVGCPTFTADLAPVLRRLAVDRRSAACTTSPTRAPCRGTSSSARSLRASGHDPALVRPIATRRAAIRRARRPVRPTACSTTPCCAAAGTAAAARLPRRPAGRAGRRACPDGLHPGRAGGVPRRHGARPRRARVCGCCSSASTPGCGRRPRRPTSPIRATASTRRCGGPGSSSATSTAGPG